MEALDSMPFHSNVSEWNNEQSNDFGHMLA